jgi:predicted signal transduction protein with EAL and GGDEF domain
MCPRDRPTPSPVTISLGVAAFPVHGATGEDLLHAADEAVYKAKAKGRDRVVVAGNRPRRAIAVETPSQPQIDRESRPAS